MGVCSTSWASARPPGGRALASSWSSTCSSATLAITSAVPRCRCTGVPLRKALASPGHSCSRTSMRAVSCATSGAHSHWPRCTASRSMPASATAQRWPAWACCAGWFCECRLRTRSRRSPGTRRSSSPTTTCPACTLPVATVPVPPSVKARSTASRKAGPLCCGRGAAACCSRCSRSAGTPSPLGAATSNTGAPASAVGASSACTWACTSARRVASTRSVLVMATVPSRRPSRLATARCSCVCGITPSSAATSSSRWSMPVAPASMVCSSRSWPGTSTKPITWPPGAGR